MSKFDYELFRDEFYNWDMVVFSYKKWEDKIEEMKEVVKNETGFNEMVIRTGYARYTPYHEFFDGGAGYIIVDEPTRGAFKVFIVEEVKQ